MSDSFLLCGSEATAVKCYSWCSLSPGLLKLTLDPGDKRFIASDMSTAIMHLETVWPKLELITCVTKTPRLHLVPDDILK